MSPRAPESLPPDISRWQLRFVMLGGGTAWLFHLIVAWATTEFGVLSGFSQNRWAGLSAVSWLILAFSLALLALAGLALLASWRLKRTVPIETEAHRAVNFCARFGVITNLVFLVIIAVQTLPLLFLSP